MKIALRGCIAALAALALLSSCSDDDNNTEFVSFSFPTKDFNATTGEWNYCYDAAYNDAVTTDNLTFHRTADATEWGGVTYYSWKGFTPSISTDNSDHSGDFITYQYGAMAGHSVAGNGYLVACWDSQESLTEIPSSPSVKITAKEAVTIDNIVVCNSAYAYYAMKNGDDFSKKFGSDDWFKLYVHGVKNGKLTGTVETYLAKGTEIPANWFTVDTKSLGEVDMIYFQLASSDSGQWGMNTPGYFCLGALTVER